MTLSFSARALLLASALALAPAAYAETPADTLVVAAQIDDIISLDPAQSFEFSGNDVTQNLYDRLVDFDALDLSKGYQPSLAESWQMSEDGLTLTLTMREGVTFQSGNPVRAEDAAWSLQRAVKLDKTPAFILTQFGFTKDNVDQKVRATDARTLVMETDQAYAPTFVLYCLTAGVASIVDSKLVQQNEKDGDFGTNWLKTNSAGSGPFKLRQWKASEMLMLDAYPGYWQGGPAMKRVIIRHIPEPATQRLLLEKGDVDVARNLKPEQFEPLRASKDIRLVEAPKGTLWYISLNQKNEILAKPEVRKAMRHLVDYDAMRGSIMNGLGTVHQAFLPKGFLGAVEDKPFKYDPAKARELLAAAGYPDGFTVTMDVRNTSPTMDMAQTIQASAAAAGNMMLPLTTNKIVSTSASRPEMPITMPWYSVNELTLSL